MQPDHNENTGTQEGWFVHFGIGPPPKGPYSPASILDMIAHGEIEPSTLVFHRDYKDGEKVWAERVPEFASAFLQPAVMRKNSLKLWSTGFGVSIFLAVGGSPLLAIIIRRLPPDLLLLYIGGVLLLVLCMLFIISMQIERLTRKLK